MFVKNSKKRRNDSGTGTLMVEKMIKRTKNNPIPESSYAESNAVAIKANILWHKYEKGDCIQ